MNEQTNPFASPTTIAPRRRVKYGQAWDVAGKSLLTLAFIPAGFSLSGFWRFAVDPTHYDFDLKRMLLGAIAGGLLAASGFVCFACAARQPKPAANKESAL